MLTNEMSRTFSFRSSEVLIFNNNSANISGSLEAWKYRMLFKNIVFIAEKFLINFAIHVVFPDCKGLMRSMKNGKSKGMVHFLIWKKKN